MLFLPIVIWLFCKYNNNINGLKPFMESALFFFFFKLLADNNIYKLTIMKIRDSFLNPVFSIYIKNMDSAIFPISRQLYKIHLHKR